MKVRRATTADLRPLLDLEAAAYEPWRRASRWSMARSLRSATQEVWVVDGGAGVIGRGRRTPSRDHAHIIGSLVLWLFPKSVRVYGVTVHPDMQGQGVGRALMAHAENIAQTRRAQRLILEARPGRLIAWYEGLGYAVVKRLPGFYGEGKDAIRLEKQITRGS